MDLYGVSESNPLVDPQAYHESATKRIVETVDWTSPRLARVTRLRLVSDRDVPYWYVSYCHGVLQDGTPCEVSLPFSELTKRRISREIVAYARKDGVYAKGLGILGSISTLI